MTKPYCVSYSKLPKTHNLHRGDNEDGTGLLLDKNGNDVHNYIRKRYANFNSAFKFFVKQSCAYIEQKPHKGNNLLGPVYFENDADVWAKENGDVKVYGDIGETDDEHKPKLYLSLKASDWLTKPKFLKRNFGIRAQQLGWSYETEIFVDERTR